jgi:site-specific DNA-methyltransferase (adenine-specific)/site-specific DNA-methyltransferase (cytosine-N4-specific)
VSHLFAKADACRLPLESGSVDLIIGSPPYMDRRTYGIGATRQCEDWVSWMLDVTEEALRVTKGAVIWIVGGSTKKRRYQPGPEMLLADGWRRGWGMEAPCYWHRFGISGSGGDQWFRKNIEYCLCFKAVDKLPWSDNLARGHAPKCKPGGAVSHRKVDGSRVANGKRIEVKIANPGNLINTGASGGGNIGDQLAHDNEAPFPEELVDFFIASLCPPGGIVCDPFSGSFTTTKVAVGLGRKSIGFDIRLSQCELGKRRMSTFAAVS